MMAILKKRDAPDSRTIGFAILGIFIFFPFVYIVVRWIVARQAARPLNRSPPRDKSGMGQAFLQPIYRVAAKLGNKKAKARIESRLVGDDWLQPRSYHGRDIRENTRYSPHSNTNSRDSDLRSSAELNHELPDRRVSTRSIATLPVYHERAGDDELVIGLEGERSGVDHVVTLPEPESDLEAQREQEMAALYRVRQLRRALRDRLRDLRAQIAAAKEAHHPRSEIRQLGLSIEQEESRFALLIAEAQEATELVRSRGRSRRVSSVSYLDVGLARHDGSRVREHSPGHLSTHSRQGSQPSIAYSRVGAGEGEGDDEHHHLIRHGAVPGTLTPPLLSRPWARSPFHSRNSSHHSLAAAPWDAGAVGGPTSPLAQHIATAGMTDVDLRDDVGPPSHAATAPQSGSPSESVSAAAASGGPAVPPDYEALVAGNADAEYGDAPPYELTGAEDLEESLRRVQTRERRIPRRPVSGPVPARVSGGAAGAAERSSPLGLTGMSSADVTRPAVAAVEPDGTSFIERVRRRTGEHKEDEAGEARRSSVGERVGAVIGDH